MVLKDIQQQLDEDKPLRQWQTDWPSKQTQIPGNVLTVIVYEPVREKTNNLGSDQVRHKQGCTVTDRRLEA